MGDTKYPNSRFFLQGEKVVRQLSPSSIFFFDLYHKLSVFYMVINIKLLLHDWVQSLNHSSEEALQYSILG